MNLRREIEGFLLGIEKVKGTPQDLSASGGLHIRGHRFSVVRVRVRFAHEIAVFHVGFGPAEYLAEFRVESEFFQSAVPNDQKDRNVVNNAQEQLGLQGEFDFHQLAVGDIMRNDSGSQRFSILSPGKGDMSII